MLNIDKLRYTYEKPFLDLMEGMERKVHPDYPHRTLWYKENDWYFKQDEKIGYLWCQYDRVWSFFKTNYSSKYAEIQVIIRDLMERHYKLKALTPIYRKLFQILVMERHYKLKALTPAWQNGNLQRSSAISTICNHSDCTVAYTVAEFKVLSNWIKSVL